MERILTSIKSLDINPKALDEFRTRTSWGGLMSIITAWIMGFLFMSELKYYYTTERVGQMVVDGTRQARVSVMFDVSFPSLACDFVAVDIIDVAGNVANNFTESILYKQSIDPQGNPIGERIRMDAGGTLREEEHVKDMLAEITKTEQKEPTDKSICLSCYGAKSEDECCNTCQALLFAYRLKGWSTDSLHLSPQCNTEKLLRIANHANEGCNITGMLVVDKVAGRIHFGPGMDVDETAFKYGEVLEFMFEGFNSSHRFNYLAFGQVLEEDMVNPLDGVERIVPNGTHGIFQYYLKVVPTQYTRLDGQRMLTNQYSVTEHFRVTGPESGRGLPGLLLNYEFSPIAYYVEERRKGFLQFLTSVCAIVGGVFTVMGILDRLLEGTVMKAGRRGSAKHQTLHAK